MPSRSGYAAAEAGRRRPIDDEPARTDDADDDDVPGPEHLLIEMKARQGIERLDSWQRMRGALFQDAGALCREWTWEAVDVVKGILMNPGARDRDRLEAAHLLLDRGHGRAPLSVGERVEELSDEELRQQLKDAAKAILGLEPDANS